MQLSAEQLAQLLGGKVVGDPEVFIDRLSKIEEGGKGSVTFLGNPKYEEYVYTTTASVLLVQEDFVPRSPIAITMVKVEDVYASLAFLMEKFGGSSEFVPGISNRAIIASDADIGNDVFIGDFTIISAHAKIGDRCMIHPQVYIGNGVRLGNRVTIFPGVRILDHCEVGDDCIIHSNAVIGSDGFGFAPQPDGSFKKIPQTGNVHVEEQVEIGANVTIDRASIGSTRIRKGAKLDNLIHIAHNVEIGAHTVMAAQVGVAGSTKIGQHCQIGGQVGFAGHLTIADRTGIQAQSGLAQSVKEPDQKLFGSPAFNYNDFIKSFSVFRKLPELYRTLAKIRRKVDQLENRF